MWEGQREHGRGPPEPQLILGTYPAAFECPPGKNETLCDSHLPKGASPVESVGWSPSL
jgi:hypothetical protein